MWKVTALEGHNLFDLAIQQCGGTEAVFEMAWLNNLVVTDFITHGAELTIPEPTNIPVAGYYQVNNLKPATDANINWSEQVRIFEIELPYEWE